MENYDDSYDTIHDRLSRQKPEDGSLEFVESPFFLKHYYQSKKKFEDTNRIDWEDIVENLKDAKKISDTALSSYFGKQSSYVSVLRARGLEPSLDAIARMTLKISDELDEFETRALRGEVEQGEWATAATIREALQQLVRKMQMMVKYPDGKIPNQKKVTSWI